MSSGGLESACQQGLIQSDDDLMDFVKHSLESYSCSTLPYIQRVYHVLERESKSPSELLDRVVDLDSEYEALMGSNHVGRRSSVSQGVAYLTLGLKSLSPHFQDPSRSTFSGPETLEEVMRALRTLVRKGKCNRQRVAQRLSFCD